MEVNRPVATLPKSKTFCALIKNQGESSIYDKYTGEIVGFHHRQPTPNKATKKTENRKFLSSLGESFTLIIKVGV